MRTTERSAHASLLPCLLLLSACGGAAPPAEESDSAKLPQAQTVTAKLPEPQPATAEMAADRAVQNSVEAAPELAEQEPGATQPTPASVSRDANGTSRYTSLEPASCDALKEMGAGGEWRRRCAGASGYSVEMSESGARKAIVIISPNGKRSELSLASLGATGGFDSVGKVAEWRGPSPERPRALIVRVNAGGQRSGISNLVVARLDQPACVVAVVPRGPDQNSKARAIADGKLPDCVKE